MFNRLNNQQPFDPAAFIKMLAELTKENILTDSLHKPKENVIRTDELAKIIFVLFQDEFCGEVALLSKNVIGLQFETGDCFQVRIEKTKTIIS